MRKSGYYWIKARGLPYWEIGYWSSEFNIWSLTGDQSQYTNDDMLQVDEKEIVR